MNVNANNTNLLYFQQGVRHIRKIQKGSKINLTINNTGNRSLSRVSSIDSKLSSDDKLPPAINTAMIKKQTIFIYPTERNLSASNTHSAKLLPSRDNSLSSSHIPKLPPAISSSKLLESNDKEFLTPQKQNSLKTPNHHQNSINNENKNGVMPKPRISVKRNTDIIEKENNTQNKTYLKRPKFILKQKEMFHYGDKLHDLIEKEKKEYIQKKNMGKTEAQKELPLKNAEKNNINISDSEILVNSLLEKYQHDVCRCKILTFQYKQDDEFIALGCEDGKIRTYDTGKRNLLLLNEYKSNPTPGMAISNVRWRPKTLENILLTATATGHLTLWDVLHKKILHTFDESENQIYGLDYNLTANRFSTSGMDKKIRIYDDFTGKLITYLQAHDKSNGHSNRIFALKFDNKNENILYSGGWDETVYIWDIRLPSAVGFIHGPMICGDSLDQRDSTLLCGSWREKQNLQIFDLKTLKLRQNLEWKNNKTESEFIYTCKISKLNENFIIAGTVGSKKEILLFSDVAGEYKFMDRIEKEEGIFSIDFENRKNQFGFATNGKYGVVNII